MAELNDTYVVHTAMIRCSMGMRETYLVLDDTHGVFLRQQPQMTVDDSVGEVNVRCFGGWKIRVRKRRLTAYKRRWRKNVPTLF